jgi:hypothetical protein
MKFGPYSNKCKYFWLFFIILSVFVVHAENTFGLAHNCYIALT